MLDIKTYHRSYKAAVQWSNWYLEHYHPAGYSTRLNEPTFDKEYRRWVVRGKRARSCD